eukprot:GGOE01061573.1.p1 GENE.GGOE01061573.1~~GGOE01061573.1.p1  ORF type:complete len:413 (+),score=72.55 GGOE01061573.1:23-1240(+)
MANRGSVKGRSFDISRYKQRHIALRMAYLGEHYRGLAIQENVADTIESLLFSALEKTCLIVDRASCNYSRCGRTDKGVSALGQVIALHVRSNLSVGAEFVGDKGDDQQGEAIPASSCVQNTNSASELDYVKMLNRVLPADIRILAWAPVPKDFSARFSCVGRIYKYFFLQRDLDISRMRQAARHLVGEHDFRHFCKMDVVHVSNFVREIRSFDIAPCLEMSANGPAALWVATIHGTAFLYHQVRCMMQVLFEVGAGMEDPEVVEHLLDVERVKNKPQYPLASETGLILWDCQFKDLSWTSTADAQRLLMAHLFQAYEERVLRSGMVSAMQSHMMNEMMYSELRMGTEVLREVQWKDVPAESSKRKYVPLLSRDTEFNFEERVEGLSAAKRAKRETNLKKGGEMRK